MHVYILSCVWIDFVCQIATNFGLNLFVVFQFVVLDASWLVVEDIIKEGSRYINFDADQFGMNPKDYVLTQLNDNQRKQCVELAPAFSKRFEIVFAN